MAKLARLGVAALLGLLMALALVVPGGFCPECDGSYAVSTSDRASADQYDDATAPRLLGSWLGLGLVALLAKQQRGRKPEALLASEIRHFCAAPHWCSHRSGERRRVRSRAMPDHTSAF